MVTEDYHLVTNQQAYDLAADVLKQVFDFTSMADGLLEGDHEAIARL